MKKRPRILIVDDEANIHYSFQKMLPETYDLLEARSAEAGLEMLRSHKPDVVVMDVKLPKRSGLEALHEMRDIDARVPVIMMTAFGTVNTAINAMKMGAFEYLLKPFEINKMRQVLMQALESSALMQRVVYLSGAEPGEPDDSGDTVIGASQAMQEVYKLIGQVAEQKVTVLICGESGTGKELIARAIYQHSKRMEAPFLEINCAALPENLQESELFGYEKGAFTGAEKQHIGKFEQVHGGTLFLDEIGEMSLLTQAKILRVIEDGTFSRIGGKAQIKTDVRILAATNRNLDDMIRAGQFREDLYYRLNVITINLPPLRDRREDIPHLVNYFIAKYNRISGRQIKGIDAAALELCLAHPLPGNVRQLENSIRRAVVLARGLTISMQDLDLEPAGENRQLTPEHDSLESIATAIDRFARANPKTELWPALEKLAIETALRLSEDNQVKAAHLLGIHRNTLRNRMDKYAVKTGEN